MKLGLVLLALLPFALAVPVEKRFLGFPRFLDLDYIKHKAQEILDHLGSDVHEQKCEDTCHSTFAVDETHLIHTICTPLCRSFQSVVNLFGLRPHLKTTPPVTE